MLYIYIRKNKKFITRVTSNMNTLPPEILCTIFKHVPIDEVCTNIPRVCDRWRDAVATGFVKHDFSEKLLEMCRAGDLESMKIFARYRVDSIPECLFVSCERKHFELVLWLVFNYDELKEVVIVHRNKLIEQACRNGHLKFIKLIMSKYKPFIGFIEPIHNWSNALIECCANGHLDTMRWLKGRCNLTRDILFLENDNAFIHSCKNGHLEMVKWLTVTFEITRNEAILSNNEAFIKSCENGHVHVAEWLKTKFQLISKGVLHNNSAFIRSCGNGHLDMVKWLKKTYHLTAADASSNNFRALYRSCENGYLDEVEWLVGTFNLELTSSHKKKLTTPGL